MVDFFQSLFGQAGESLVNFYNDISSFIVNCPSWLGVVFIAVLTVLVVRIVINVF